MSAEEWQVVLAARSTFRIRTSCAEGSRERPTLAIHSRLRGAGMTVGNSGRQLGTIKQEAGGSQRGNHGPGEMDAEAVITLQAVRDEEGIVNDFVYRDMNAAAQELLSRGPQAQSPGHPA